MRKRETRRTHSEGTCWSMRRDPIVENIAISLFGNMTVETGEIHIITSISIISIRTKDLNNHSDTEMGTLSKPARPWLYEGMKCRQRRRKISAWRGHEDIGGEGQLGREPGRPRGDQFFPREDLCKLQFVLNFTFTFTFASESEVKVKFNLASFCSSTVCNSM